MGLLKKVWYFIWYDESIWSWIVNIALAFILIKYLIYPGLGLILGTKYPIVAVVSGSMEHKPNFESWWNSACFKVENEGNKIIKQKDIYENKGITKEKFLSFKLRGGFNMGDIVILKGGDNLKVGDIIVFKASNFKDPIIHRIFDINLNSNGERVYQTKGDRNCLSAPHELEIKEDQIIGKALFVLPLLGWIKIIAVVLFQIFISIFGW